MSIPLHFQVIINFLLETDSSLRLRSWIHQMILRLPDLYHIPFQFSFSSLEFALGIFLNNLKFWKSFSLKDIIE